jgi:5'-3' exonuclease
MRKGKLAIIDSDCFLFQAGWGYKEQLTKLGELGVKKRVDHLISTILNRLEVTHYLGFYGKHDHKNFRHDWATIKPYKGQRDHEPWQEYFKPKIKDYYATKWGFHGTGNIEADDAVIIAYHQYKDDYDIIMVGEDKDMKQLGSFTRFNPTKKIIEKINHEEGRKFFWCQMLHGDSTDNIGGIEGIGTNNKAISQLMNLEYSEENLYNFVRDQYIIKYGSRYMYHMMENYMLLKMMDKPCFDYPLNIEPIKWKQNIKFTPKTLINL